MGEGNTVAHKTYGFLPRIISKRKAEPNVPPESLSAATGDRTPLLTRKVRFSGPYASLRILRPANQNISDLRPRKFIRRPLPSLEHFAHFRPAGGNLLLRPVRAGLARDHGRADLAPG